MSFVNGAGVGSLAAFVQHMPVPRPTATSRGAEQDPAAMASQLEAALTAVGIDDSARTEVMTQIGAAIDYARSHTGATKSIQKAVREVLDQTGVDVKTLRSALKAQRKEPPAPETYPATTAEEQGPQQNAATVASSQDPELTGSTLDVTG